MSLDLIKELREKTGAGMMDCKNALAESGNDIEKAVEYLRKKGIAKAEKKLGRSTGQGMIQSYIHAGGKIGVLVEVNCETDFVARTDEFQKFAHEIALHIAAANPKYLSKEDVTADDLERERRIFKAEAETSGKPANVVDKIVEGKINRYYNENCLLHQAWVKDPDKSIDTLLKELIGKIGENVAINRFTRFQLGESVNRSEG